MERLRYIIEDALTNIRRSGWVGVASIGTIAVSFLIVGIFLIITGNLGALVAGWKEQFQVTIFLEDGITTEQLTLLKKRIQSERAVKAVTYTSKAEALQQFKRELVGKESLLEGLGENPIPASFQLRIHEAYQTPEALRQFVPLGGQLMLSRYSWSASSATRTAKVRLLIHCGRPITFGYWGPPPQIEYPPVAMS